MQLRKHWIVSIEMEEKQLYEGCLFTIRLNLQAKCPAVKRVGELKTKHDEVVREPRAYVDIYIQRRAAARSATVRGGGGLGGGVRGGAAGARTRGARR
jgi:hypothetical protein